MNMLHPSYTELIEAANKNVPEGEEPVVTSRYSIVIATAKRARQLVAGEEALVEADDTKKPLSIAVDELKNGQIAILPACAADENEETEEEAMEMVEETVEAAEEMADNE
jgi:DNA-directed RNA polymerase subunit omega